MPEESGGEGFTVVDRRERRDAAEPAPEPGSRSLSRERAERPGPGPVPASAASAEVDLAALFLMLASSALVHLGMAPDPAAGTARRDLAQARLSIDLLRLLRDKTDGNRSSEESQLLEGLLHDLQLQFVEAVEGHG